MIVRIVGKAPMTFTDEKTGEVVTGIVLYYYAPKDEVDGCFAGQLWVKEKSPLFNKLLLLSIGDTFVKPLMADVVYDVIPGKKVRLLLTDIKLLDDKDSAPPETKKSA